MAKGTAAKMRGPTGEAKELVDLVVAYAKQETIAPLKGLGKKALFGIAGSVLIGIGGIFLAMALLRALQSETDFFERHNLSYLPYFIAIGVLGLASLVGWVGLGPGKKAK